MSSNSSDRVMEAYYNDIRRSVILTREQQRALFKAYRTCTKCRYCFGIEETAGKAPKCPKCNTKRDFKSRDRIVESALRFVVKAAKTYAHRAKGSSADDELVKTLISAGNLGLLVAVDKFDPTMGTRFLTYAAHWVREKILEELDNMGVVRVPAYKQKDLRARRKQGDRTVPDTPHVVLEELTEVDNKHQDDTLERDLLNHYGVDMIYTALSELKLESRDRYIIIAYFGIKEEAKNLRQISSRLNISSERVRQIKKEVLERLQTHLEQNKVSSATDVFTE